jgi:hypothetical protein
VTGYLDS